MSKTTQIIDSLKSLTSEERVEAVVEIVSALTTNEAAQAATKLEEKHGLVGKSFMGGGSAPAASADESDTPTEFDVEIKDIGEKKIEVIKLTRELTGLGLGESKTYVEDAGRKTFGGLMNKVFTKAEAEALVERLKQAGAQATVKAK